MSECVCARVRTDLVTQLVTYLLVVVVIIITIKCTPLNENADER